jgi:hypothetical protein
LRDAFKELTQLHEPIMLDDAIHILLPMLADGIGALLIFAGLHLYYGRYRRRAKHPPTGQWLYPFVAFKKFLAFCLLLFFLSFGLWTGWHSATTGQVFDFFSVFYTVLIFSDIFLVLLSHTYQSAFKTVFRNSGYALATLLIRFALAAPAYYAPLLGVSAMIFAYGVSLATDVFDTDF